MSESFLSLVVATGLLLGSPGPAPLALAATGATYGVRTGTPFLLGILSGLLFAIIGATAGLAALLLSFPQLRLTLQLLGAAYMAYIAFKIASAPVIANSPSQSAPGFRHGFILNLLNPKAYAAFLAIFSQFLLPIENLAAGYIITGLTCLVVATVVDVLWLCMGGILKPVFSHPTQARVVRIGFSFLMLAAVIYALV